MHVPGCAIRSILGNPAGNTAGNPAGINTIPLPRYLLTHS